MMQRLLDTLASRAIEEAVLKFVSFVHNEDGMARGRVAAALLFLSWILCGSEMH
jgi:hypothetical protein